MNILGLPRSVSGTRALTGHTLELKTLHAATSRRRSMEVFMQFIDVIKKRRAIRNYTDKPVERS
jgi:hypothetical protein